MEKEFDKLLSHVLTPNEEPSFWLNQKIMKQIQEQKTIVGRGKRRLSAAMIMAALTICVSSVTVLAAWKYLSSDDVARNVQDTKLAEAFVSKQAFVINETQSYGKYRVTLLSMVTGEMLSDFLNQNEIDSISSGRTYAVVAIENLNGVPMPDTSEDGYEELEIFVSPLISDYNPASYNIASMSGNYTDITENGILYRLLECDNVEIFAEHNLYLCVSEGMFYNTEAYDYDELTGKITRNEEYGGLNALFNLPIDISKANPEKAFEYIASLGYESAISKEKLTVELEANYEVEITEENKLGAEVAEYALQFIGNPYVWGDDSLTAGADSSGFTKSVYERFGIHLPHDSKMQYELGVKVEDLKNIAIGDLVFYDTPSHVAIYIGEELIIHSMPQEGICVSKVDFDEVLGIRRILGVE